MAAETNVLCHRRRPRAPWQLRRERHKHLAARASCWAQSRSNIREFHDRQRSRPGPGSPAGERGRVRKGIFAALPLGPLRLIATLTSLKSAWSGQ